MRYPTILFLISLLWMGVACTSESTSPKRESEEPKQTQTAVKPKPPQKKKPEFKGMLVEEKPTLQVVGNDGKVQKVTVEQPQVAMTSVQTPKATVTPSPAVSASTAATPAAPSPQPKKTATTTTPKVPVPVTVVPPSATVKTPPAPPTTPKATLSHAPWHTLLQKHVDTNGKVNYKGFQKDKNALHTYLDLLRNNPIQDDWSRSKKMAYWINAYNAFTIKLIVDNYPLSSITDLDGGKPWDKKWITLGDKTYSLNNIENDILRPQYKDARIHFAVNCAAKSCPPLLNQAWTADNLEANFEKQAKAFINNSDYNEIATKKVRISKIFEWYAEDFGDLVAYLNRYSNTTIKSDAKVEYKEYDWSLNE